MTDITKETYTSGVIGESHSELPLIHLRSHTEPSQLRIV